MKVYISGAISGWNPETVAKKFLDAENELKEKGYEPVNPLNNGLDNTASWLDHMRVDIKMLMDCDAIYMLKCCYESKGAIIEQDLARKLGLKVFLQKHTA